MVMVYSNVSDTKLAQKRYFRLAWRTIFSLLEPEQRYFDTVIKEICIKSICTKHFFLKTCYNLLENEFRNDHKHNSQWTQSTRSDTMSRDNFRKPFLQRWSRIFSNDFTSVDPLDLNLWSTT